MSIGEDSGSSVGFDTMHGRDYPTIRQFTVFMENRVGQLHEVLRRFRGSEVRILALNIIDSTECCVVSIRAFRTPNRAARSWNVPVWR